MNPKTLSLLRLNRRWSWGRPDSGSLLFRTLLQSRMSRAGQCSRAEGVPSQSSVCCRDEAIFYLRSTNDRHSCMRRSIWSWKSGSCESSGKKRQLEPCYRWLFRRRCPRNEMLDGSLCQWIQVLTMLQFGHSPLSWVGGLDWQLCKVYSTILAENFQVTIRIQMWTIMNEGRQ